MASFKLYLTVVALVTFSLICLGSTKPLKVEKRLRAFKNMGKAKHTAALNKRTSKECLEIMGSNDYRAFADEVAYAFLSSGNTNALDNILAYMVENKCVSLSTTITI